MASNRKKRLFTVAGPAMTPNHRSEWADNTGFSLIEVLIAMFILSFGILAVCSMQISGLKGNATSHQYTKAITLGVEKMETLQSLPYDSNSLGDTDSDGATAPDYGLYDATTGTADYTETNASGQYTIFWNVADEILVANTKTVSVVVLWDDTGMQRSVSLQCVIPEII